MLTNTNINCIIIYVSYETDLPVNADVAELADAQDLKSCG